MEEIKGEDQIELLESTDELDIYGNDSGSELNIIDRKSGYVAGYENGAIFTHPPHGYEKKNGTVGDALLMGRLAVEVYERLGSERRKTVYLGIINSDGFGDKRKKLFERYFELEALPENRFHCFIKGVKRHGEKF